jgi:hypothetical protein
VVSAVRIADFLRVTVRACGLEPRAAIAFVLARAGKSLPIPERFFLAVRVNEALGVPSTAFLCGVVESFVVKSSLYHRSSFIYV